jgi:hypothetical protein
MFITFYTPPAGISDKNSGGKQGSDPAVDPFPMVATFDIDLCRLTAAVDYACRFAERDHLLSLSR